MPASNSISDNQLFLELSRRLTSAVKEHESRLREIGEAEAASPIAEGKWSRKQIVGHLIDSASYNHHRFLRTQLKEERCGMSYDQDGCVRLSTPDTLSWQLLLTLWSSYNLYLAHILANTPAEASSLECRIDGGASYTLQFIAEDYVRHLLHHLEQIDVC